MKLNDLAVAIQGVLTQANAEGVSINTACDAAIDAVEEWREEMAAPEPDDEEDNPEHG
jgi:hypothetical protein